MVGRTLVQGVRPLIDSLPLALVTIFVVIDNALLAGLVVPHSTLELRRRIIVWVGMAVSVTQVLSAIGIDALLSEPLFRVAAFLVLTWMSIRSITMLAPPMRDIDSLLSMVVKLWFFTVIGNADNMIWLGSELKTRWVWLTVFSLMTIPLFVAVAMFLSKQRERHGWIRYLGAGMMAWAASSLFLAAPYGRFLLETSPSTNHHLMIQTAVTISILSIGWVSRLLHNQPRA